MRHDQEPETAQDPEAVPDPEAPGSVDSSEGGHPRWLKPLAVGSATAAVGLLLLWFVVIPYPRGLQEGDPGTSALMKQRMEEAEAAGDSLLVRREWVPLAEVSSNLQRAVVVAEDYRFREHEGIDWVSLAEEVEWTGDDDFSWFSPSDVGALVTALRFVWANRSDLRGRSTLTQQLAKNLYFGTERSLVRKVMEAVVAKRLERHLDKDRILELYLNIAEWGPGVFGAEAAAQTYFGRSASNLSVFQAATLAATLPHPLTSNLHVRPGRMAWRRDLILDRIDPSRRMPAIPSPMPPPTFDADFVPPSVPTLPPPPDTAVETDSVGLVADSATTPLEDDVLPRPDDVARPDTTVRGREMVQDAGHPLNRS